VARWSLKSFVKDFIEEEKKKNNLKVNKNTEVYGLIRKNITQLIQR